MRDFTHHWTHVAFANSFIIKNISLKLLLTCTHSGKLNVRTFNNFQFSFSEHKMSDVTSDQKLDDNEPPSQPASAELERRKKIEAKMFKNQKRHYKKDTRYVLDLYTIAYDEDETVESVGERPTI